MNFYKKQKKIQRNKKRRLVKKIKEKNKWDIINIKELQESKKNSNRFKKENYMSLEDSLKYTKYVLSNVIKVDKIGKKVDKKGKEDNTHE